MTNDKSKIRLGVDVGGTFTDVVLIDDETGEIHYAKTPTTPKNLAEGVLTGLEKILNQAGATMGQAAYIAHGTTIGTNALIERKGAKVGLITTAGFRDVLEIARIERPDAGLYDMSVDLPAPLVPRYLRLEADERVGADGAVVKPLDEASVTKAVEKLKAEGVEAIAVCLLFSFRNPAHERAIRDICREMYPGVPVSLSSDVAPEFREFERTSTTVINAYLSPVIERYLDSLTAQLSQKYGPVDLRIMQASGGAMTAEAAKSRAVNMVNSGPAGGALATALFGRLAGEDKLISVDMGGTSFDIGLVVGGQPRVKPEGEFEGYPVKIPLIDVEGIGAGGGSIAWVDAGGALNVGPASAGADPGPVCYGRGGSKPTVTDANLVLGRLNPDYFLGREMRLHPNEAREAIKKYVVGPIAAAGGPAYSIEEAAAGIIRVVNANMIRGISVNTTQKGYDAREFSMLAFGGAGALHAVELAQEMGVSRVIIPPFCAVFSAFGAVASDVRYDYVETVALSQQAATAERLQTTFAKLEARARRQLTAEKVAGEHIIINWAVDLRYEGQSYELTIPIQRNGSLTEANVARATSDFHNLHRRIYAYGAPSEPVEFISIRVAGVGKVPPVNLGQGREAVSSPEEERGRQGDKERGRGGDKGTGETRNSELGTRNSNRSVYFHGSGFVPTDVYRRDALQTGARFEGPCLIEERTSTTVIPPGARGLIDEYGNIVVEVTEENY